MNFEAMPQTSVEKNEKNERVSFLEKFKSLSDKMSISDKMKKRIEITLASLVAVAVVEGSSVESAQGAELSNDMQEIVDALKQEKESEVKSFFGELSEKLGVKVEDMNEILKYQYSFEDASGDESGKFHKEIDGDIEKSGDDICFASYTSVDAVELIGGEEKAEMWNSLASEARAFSLNGAEVTAASDTISFEATSYSEDNAIISALADAAQMQNGVMVGTEKRLDNHTATTNTVASNYEEKFVSEISSERYGVIDHYEVKSVEQNESGMYKVSVDVVFGEIVK